MLLLLCSMAGVLQHCVCANPVSVVNLLQVKLELLRINSAQPSLAARIIEEHQQLSRQEQQKQQQQQQVEQSQPQQQSQLDPQLQQQQQPRKQQQWRMSEKLAQALARAG
jgi:biopolymer transport protein ExbB/TolQ